MRIGRVRQKTTRTMQANLLDDGIAEICAMAVVE
jgi:hypothetical protein